MKVQSLEALLETLAESSKQVEAGRRTERPRLTLLLRSGRSLSGTLLELSRDRNVNTLTLSLEEKRNRFDAPDIAFVPLTALEAIVLMEAEDLEKPPERGPVPGKLELKRAVRAVQDELQAAGHALELSFTGSLEEEIDREALNDALKPLGAALERIGADPMGREALSRVKQMVLELGEEAVVKCEEESLRLVVPRAYPSRPDTAGWRDLLEAAL